MVYNYLIIFIGRRRNFLSKEKKTKDSLSYNPFDHGLSSNLTVGSSLASQTLPSLEDNNTPSIQSLDLITKSDGDIIKKNKLSRHLNRKTSQHHVGRSSPQIDHKNIISIDMQNMLLQRGSRESDNDSMEGGNLSTAGDSVLLGSDNNISNYDNSEGGGEEEKEKGEDDQEELDYYESISQKFQSMEALKDFEQQTEEQQEQHQEEESREEESRKEVNREEVGGTKEEEGKKEDGSETIQPVRSTTSTTLVIDMSSLDKK